MGLVTKTFTFSAGATIIASEHNTNFDNLYTVINGNLNNANIVSGAAIGSAKLDLSAITQTVSIANDVTLGGGANHALILNFNDGITFTPAATWTFSAGQTVSGTWTDLGTVTTVDINGGTLDGVQIGGTTATGELIVNNSSDAAAGLGSQGSSGQYLKSAGAGANPTWATIVASNVIYHNMNNSQANSVIGGIITNNTSLTASDPAVNQYSYWVKTVGTSFTDIGPSFQWVKIAGVSTITVYATLRCANAGDTWAVQLTVGSATGDTGNLAASAATTPTAFSWTVDVSGLVNGTQYDCQFQAKKTTNSDAIRIYEVSIMGS